MADTPITGLPLASSVLSSDVLPIVQGGVTRQATAALLVAAGKNDREYAQTGIPAAQDSTSTPTTVTYDKPFDSATTVISGIVFVNYSGSDFPVFTYKISNVTKSGFSILVGGGQSGSTVDLHYRAIGQ